MSRSASSKSYLSFILASAICCATLAWLYANTDRRYHYEEYYPDLYNSTTHKWNYPKYFMNITRNILRPDEWFERTNAREQLYESSLFWNTMALVWLQHEYVSKKDLKLSGQPVADEVKCGQQLDWILGSLDRMPDPSKVVGIQGYQLTRYLDSFGRPEPSFHWAGALNWYGSHSLCLQAHMDRPGDETIKTRYCLGHFRYASWPRDDMIKPKNKIRIGLCLPETCDTNSYEKYKREIEFLAKYELNGKFKQELVFDSMYCLPDERSPLRQIPRGGRLLLWILATWFALVCLLSVLRSQIKRQFCAFLEPFTLQNSLKLLVRKPTDNPNGSSLDFRCWNFIKVILSILVIFGHTNSVTHYYTRTFIARWIHTNRLLTRICFTFGHLMTTHFVLFGLFSSINLLKASKRNLRELISLGTAIKMFLSRSLHIVPLYALVHFINQLVIPYLGSGPNWDYGTGVSLRQLCMQESWWRSIPFLATLFGHIAPPCNSPGWFIAAYLQLAPLVPLLTYVLAKLPGFPLKLVFTSILMLISSLNGIIRLLTQNVIGADGLTYINGFVVVVLDKFEPSAYQDALGRLGSIALGCLVGVLLLERNKNKQDSEGDETQRGNKWPAWLTGRPMVAAVLAGHLALIVVPSMGSRVNNGVRLIDFTILIALLGLCWAYLNGVLIVQLAQARQNALLSFMAHPFWNSLNKLNLAVYLMHLEIIIYANQVHEHAPSVYAHTMDIVKIFCFALWASYALAIIFYLFVEAPLNQVIEMLQSRAPRKKAESLDDAIGSLIPSELINKFEEDEYVEED